MNWNVNMKRFAYASAALLLVGAVPLADVAEAHPNHKGIIMVLDYGNNVAKNALLAAGYEECAGSVHPWDCFEMVSSSTYCGKVAQSERRVLFLGSEPDAASFGQIYGCRTTLHTAISNGLCVVAFSQSNYQDRWDWIPGGSFTPKVPTYTSASGNNYDVTTAGGSHIATAGLVGSSWWLTYHEYFGTAATQVPSYMSVLMTVKNDPSKALTMAGSWGFGGVLISGTDADDHVTKADAKQLVKQSVEWGLECSCKKPHKRLPDHLKYANPLLGQVQDGVERDLNEGQDFLVGPASALAPGEPAHAELPGGFYLTADGAVYQESNGVPGLQRFVPASHGEEGLPEGPGGDTRLA